MEVRRIPHSFQVRMEFLDLLTERRWLLKEIRHGFVKLLIGFDSLDDQRPKMLSA